MDVCNNLLLLSTYHVYLKQSIELGKLQITHANFASAYWVCSKCRVNSARKKK